MAESATYISELVPGNVGDTTDPSDGGAQLYVIKYALNNTLGSLAGAVTATHTELNYLDIATLGTAAASKALVADGSAQINAGAITWTDLGTVTTVDINGGTIDGATISASTFNGTGGTINGTVIGGTTPAAATFTTLAATSADLTALNDTIIGGSTPAAGTFTTLTANTSITLVNAITEFSTDGTLGGNSDSAVPTEQAVKEYVDAASCYVINAVIDDISTAGTVYVPISRAGTVSRVDTVLGGTIATADAGISLTTSADQGMSNITVTASGSGAGDLDSDTTINNASITAGSYLKLVTDGASTNTVPLYVSILVTIP